MISEIIPPFKLDWGTASDVQRNLLSQYYRHGCSYVNEHRDGTVYGYEDRDEAIRAASKPGFARTWKLMNYNDQESWREI